MSFYSKSALNNNYGDQSEEYILNISLACSQVDLGKVHKAHNPAQPNPLTGWVLGPIFGPTGGPWARGWVGPGVRAGLLSGQLRLYNRNTYVCVRSDIAIRVQSTFLGWVDLGMPECLS
jgi:hypothetical protein